MQKAIDGVDKMLKGMIATRWEEIDTKALSAIQVCLSNEVLRKVGNESLCMAKSVTNRLLFEE